jgi:2-iminobutanoate/2-iminopropanoate deaminase
MGAPDGVKAERIACAEVPDNPALSFSNAWRIGHEVVMSGMTARPAKTGAATPASAYEQTLVVLRKLEALVTAAGGHKHNIIKTVVYLTDMKDREDVSRARKDFFGPDAVGCYPTSTLVAVSALVSPELKVEIDAWARLDIDLRNSAQ